MTNPKVVPFETYCKNAEWFEEEFPKLELRGCLDKAFYTPGKSSLKEILEFEVRIFSDLEAVWSHLPPEKQDRFVEKCVPLWRDMKMMHEKIRTLVREMNAEQGIVIGEKGRG
jgi:hypothetical protein